MAFSRGFRLCAWRARLFCLAAHFIVALVWAAEDQEDSSESDHSNYDDGVRTYCVYHVKLL